MSVMRDYVDNYAEATEDTLLLADGFDAAIVGVMEGMGRTPAVVYDHARCVQVLMERDGMEEDEAQEFMDFNVTGAYIGDGTPVFLHRPEPEYSNTESDERIKRLMVQVGMPDSMSLYQAFKQLENELWLKGVAK